MPAVSPGSEKRQLIEGGPALPGKGMRPPVSLRLSGTVCRELSEHLRGGRCQLIKAQPHRRKRGWPGIAGGLQISAV